MEFLRWGKAGPACPHCGGADPVQLQPKAGSSTRKGVYKCRIKECRKQFTATVGTVFEDSHIPLNEVVAGDLSDGRVEERDLGAPDSSHARRDALPAWFMAHRLRYAMSSEPFEQLSGMVEVDETYMGGKRKGGKGRKRDVLKIDVPLRMRSARSCGRPRPRSGAPGSRR